MNGPTDVGSMRNIPEMRRKYPPFNPQYIVDPPGGVPRINRILKKIKIKEKDVKDLFLQVANKEYKKSLHHTSPGEAWARLGPTLFGGKV